MREPHERFLEWLAVDGNGDPPRDLALHASVCAACARVIAAQDALAEVNVALADPPPSRPTDTDYVITLARVGRLGAGIAGVILLAVVTSFGTSQLPAAKIASATPTVAEGVLGAGGAPAATASQTPKPSISPSSSPSRRRSATPAPSASPEQTLAPTLSPFQPNDSPAPPTSVPQPVPTVVPTVAPTPSGSAITSATSSPSPSVSPSPSATASPSPTATPTPEPTPLIPACSDGIDNDGDLLIDYGLDPLVNDPACLSPTDNDELLP